MLSQGLLGLFLLMPFVVGESIRFLVILIVRRQWDLSGLDFLRFNFETSLRYTLAGIEKISYFIAMFPLGVIFFLKNIIYILFTGTIKERNSRQKVMGAVEVLVALDRVSKFNMDMRRTLPKNLLIRERLMFDFLAQVGSKAKNSDDLLSAFGYVRDRSSESTSYTIKNRDLAIEFGSYEDKRKSLIYIKYASLYCVSLAVMIAIFTKFSILDLLARIFH